jgi:hypothetical protein
MMNKSRPYRSEGVDAATTANNGSAAGMETESAVSTVKNGGVQAKC